jgi:RNA polymerase subunit RPABC4/transcription elongation factor Spt4
MLDELPLELFGDDDERNQEPHLRPAPAADEVRCQFCGYDAPASAERCPKCDTRLRPVGAPAGEASQSQPRECQWCDAPLPEGAPVCPACGSRVSDPSLQILGLTAPRPSDELLMPPLWRGASFATPGSYEFGLTAARVLLGVLLGR